MFYGRGRGSASPDFESRLPNRGQQGEFQINRRPVITGLGVVSPVGIGKENYWRALEAGQNGIRKIESFDTTDYSVKIAAEVHDFDAAEFMPRKDAKRNDRAIQFAAAASVLAVKDAKLDTAALDPWRFGVYIGSGQGGFLSCTEGEFALFKGGPRTVSYTHLTLPTICSV